MNKCTRLIEAVEYMHVLETKQFDNVCCLGGGDHDHMGIASHTHRSAKWRA
jgi:hypothetical protein